MAIAQLNLTDLPYNQFFELIENLNSQLRWTKLIGNDSNDPFGISEEETTNLQRSTTNAGEYLLRYWGNRGLKVDDLLERLDRVSKLNEGLLDEAQLILKRKFVKVFWSRAEEISVHIIDDQYLQLVSHAKGFPTPNYQWLIDDELIPSQSRCLTISRCFCKKNKMFSCVVSNEITEKQKNYGFYRHKYGQLSSKVISRGVQLNSYLNLQGCEKCINGSSINVYKTIEEKDSCFMDPGQEETLVASDKVALIISNSDYVYLPGLISPHCDAETLARELQKLSFKTVTLGDLNFEEMSFMIREYAKLLGEGVYAVFYFAGHGFEINGQCCLMPTDAPRNIYETNKYISMNWVLSVFRDNLPAVNLILLDICRKSIDPNQHEFMDFARCFAIDNYVNRNTVFGYATSPGVNAYEVRDEVNGVFMKYLVRNISSKVSIVNLLNLTFQDMGKDPLVSNMQIPELRSNLTLPRSLTDTILSDNHTFSYGLHTSLWKFLHELPIPLTLKFVDLLLRVTIWFDFAGHFTNKVYIFTSTDNIDRDGKVLSASDKFIAHLIFPEELIATNERVLKDSNEGISVCLMLSNLHKLKSEIYCTVQITPIDSPREILAEMKAKIGSILINRLFSV